MLTIEREPVIQPGFAGHDHPLARARDPIPVIVVQQHDRVAASSEHQHITVVVHDDPARDANVGSPLPRTEPLGKTGTSDFRYCRKVAGFDLGLGRGRRIVAAAARREGKHDAERAGGEHQRESKIPPPPRHKQQRCKVNA